MTLDSLFHAIGPIWPTVVAILGVLVALAASAHIVLHKSDVRAAIGWTGLVWLSPFVGAVLSFAFLGEPVGLAHAAAAVLLVASVAALFWSRHGHPHVHEALEHVHSHRHDDGHHFHAHPGLPPGTRHSHVHRHDLTATVTATAVTWYV